MKKLTFLILLIILSSSAYATPLSSWDKRTFYAQFKSSCEPEAIKTGVGTREQCDDWCTCLAYETIKQITKEDLEPSQSSILLQKVGISADICRKNLLTPSGKFK